MKKKPQKIEPTEEEILQNSLRNEELHLDNIPDASVKFEVGEDVIIGNLIKPKILEVLHGGKIYLVNYWTKGAQNDYSTKDKIFNYKSYFSWDSVEKISKNDSNFSNWDCRNYRISFFSQDISELFNKLYSFGVDLEPDYQRGYVWEESDKVELIRSIFDGIEIGKFVFVSLPYSGVRTKFYEILDGKQRLSTIKDFRESKFKFEGYFWHELSIKDRSFFENSMVSVGEVREGASKEFILNQFIRLNSFGKVMDTKHLERIKKML